MVLAIASEVFASGTLPLTMSEPGADSSASRNAGNRWRRISCSSARLWRTTICSFTSCWPVASSAYSVVVPARRPSTRMAFGVGTWTSAISGSATNTVVASPCTRTSWPEPMASVMADAASGAPISTPASTAARNPLPSEFILWLPRMDTQLLFLLVTALQDHDLAGNLRSGFDRGHGSRPRFLDARHIAAPYRTRLRRLCIVAPGHHGGPSGVARDA